MQPQRFILILFLFLTSISSAMAGESLFSSLKTDLFGPPPKFLKPEEAFKVSAAAVDGHTVAVKYVPAEGYYLYKARLKFSLENAPGLQIVRVDLPKGELKDDLNLGRTEVYHQAFTANVVLDRGKDATGKMTLLLNYQGCSSKGLCYEPIDAKYVISLPDAGSAEAPSGKIVDQTSGISKLLGSGNYWLILLSFIGFGLLLALTPCTFPMIPILSGIIVGHGAKLTKTRGFILSLAYVLGLSIVYSIAGVAAGFSGVLISDLLQTPWALGGFALIFVALSLSMFGLYDLQLPSFLQSRLSETSNRLQGGHLSGVFLMGALSALIVGPCCAAPLAGALLYIGRTHDVLLGGSALFAMGFGMGLPLIAIGISAGTLLPKAGPWMQSVKNFFGVALLALAIWIVSPILPAAAVMLFYAALFIVSAIYMRAIDPLPPGASGIRKLWKGVGVIGLLVGVAFLVGALSGGRDVMHPLSGLAGSAGAAPVDGGVRFERVKSVADLDGVLAKSNGRFVMLDFYADWCISCKEMAHGTFSDPRVVAKLANVVLVQADVTENSPEDAALLKRFNLFGPPGIVLFDRQGAQIVRLVGAQGAEEFLATLNAASI
ncbi:MAG: protein-disulfide reductase DsbD [Burkholderiales bacterium]|nr:protein-disulfide reductase DsbD [Burkholderiales bacterium]